MDYKKFGSKYVVRIDKDEEIVSSVMKLCEECNIVLGSVSAIGAVGKATIGLFDTDNKLYHSTQLEGDYEITSLVGNISTKEGAVYLHFHINLSDEKYQTYGGHMNSAVVSGTCEMIIDSIEGEIDREFSDEIGLNLIKFKN